MSKSGGSAFPALNFVVPQNLSDEGVQRLGETQGMSLRDYFAAKAMQAEVTRQWEGRWINDDYEREQVAAKAYQIADAMLAEREK